MTEPPRPIRIFVDADACPVKAEIYRVAERYRLSVFVVSNSLIAIPGSALVERVVVEAGPDVADRWISERAMRGDVVITADVPLAAACVKNGAEVLGPTGRRFDTDSIGMTLATRNLMEDLRATGQSMPVKDSLVAATALAHGLTVVTRQVREFAKAGVPVLDPFEG